MQGSDWSGTRIAAGALPICRYGRSDSQAHEHRWDPRVHPLILRIKLSLFRARNMDATIYQIIFGELGDLNCSLIEAFQDTFLENASLSLLSTDGKIKMLLFMLYIGRCCFLDKDNCKRPPLF